MASLRQVLRRLPAAVGCQVLRTAVVSAPSRLMLSARPTAASVCQRVSFFHTSGLRANEHIINIQDEEDFEKRVVGSKVPVVVDFHAT